jgi:hypothetical protein
MSANDARPAAARTKTGKVEIFCAVIILMFAIAFFGALGGLLGFIILAGALLAVDYVVPHQDDASGAVIR